jgi:recombinational DNA repair ATPase RecF
MHIIGLEATNIKRLRAVKIDATGKNIIQITGRNGQGKTSVIDSLWYGIVGKRAMPEKPVRHGAQSARIQLGLGEYLVTRTITAEGNMRLTVEADGVKQDEPQKILDDLWSSLTFDPLEFVRMKPKEQVDVLKKLIGLDFEDMEKATEEDFKRRREINRDIDRVKAEIARITVQEELPENRVNENEIRARMAALDEQNKKARQLDNDKRDLETVLAAARTAVYQKKHAIEMQWTAIEILRKQLAAEEKKVEVMQAELQPLEDIEADAEDKAAAAPAGEYGDLKALTDELEQAQLINREIGKRELRNERAAELKLYQDQSNALTRAMDDREEKKRNAVETAEMPIKGLRFDDAEVTFNGIPIEQLGEGEQIRVSTSIAMAEHSQPGKRKLRILRIMHGEALDPEGMAILKEMAIEHDYQIWMAMVETSGKVGIVIEDGMVETVNEEPKHGETAVGTKKRGGGSKSAGMDTETNRG